MRVSALITKDNRYSLSPVIAASGRKVRLIQRPEEAEQGEVVLLSFNSIAALEAESILKRLPPGVITIAGGPHASGLPDHLLEVGFKYVVCGEGEEIIAGLLDYLEGKGELPPGVWTKERKGGKAPPADIEEQPPFSLSPRLVVPLEITRGCPFGCTYCQTPRLFGNRVRHRSIPTILYWLGRAAETGIKDFRFISPNALAYGSEKGIAPDKDKLYELLSAIKRKFPEARIFFGSFPSEVRPEFVDEDTVRILREFISNRRVVLGAQSGDERTLRLIRRGHTFQDVARACELLLKGGFEPHVDFIFGLPFDDESRTLAAMRELVEMGAVIHAHYFMPLPGTPLALVEPEPVSEALVKEVERLTGKGKLYGQWKRQKELSLKLLQLNRRFLRTSIQPCPSSQPEG